MGCLISKPEKVEVVDIEENNKLMENLKFYNNLKNKKIVDMYDIPNKGIDRIF